MDVQADGRATIRTPQVAARAREFFQCPDMLGAETEDDGGDGTRRGHWDQRLFEVQLVSWLYTDPFPVCM